MAPRSPVAGADTTGGAGQSQPTDDHADQPHHGGHDGPESPGAGADITGGDGDVRGRRCEKPEPPEQGGIGGGKQVMDEH